ncbi:hypothetical protein M885DRAFT_515081 [Pelagophyceae sp. CCMP2097]|nr:hypothetical protein M885DRAFT_515081 [Pelagophyceae sp. CCMP2097]
MMASPKRALELSGPSVEAPPSTSMDGGSPAGEASSDAEASPVVKKAKAAPTVACTECGKMYATKVTMMRHVANVHDAERGVAAAADEARAVVAAALALDVDDSANQSVAVLVQTCKTLQAALRGAAATSSAATATADHLAGPGAEAQATKLKQIISRGLKAQMVWSNTMKHGSKKLKFTTLTTEAVFRALVAGRAVTGKAKLTVKCDDLAAMLDASLSKSFRYSYCDVRGGETVSFSLATGELVVSCLFGQ